MIDHLKSNGVHAVFHYSSLHKSPFYQQKHVGADLANSDRFTECLVRLPLFYELGVKPHIINQIRLFYNFNIALNQKYNYSVKSIITRNSTIILLLIGGFLILSKVLLINMDPPKWDIAFYQPIDELYYVYPAYNYYETGSLINGDKTSVFGNPVISNILTYATLNIFGDNYYGLRMSSIIFSLVAFVFFLLIAKKITDNIYLLFAMTLFWSLNYNLTLASIVVEPTIARMAAMLISIYLVFSYQRRLNNKNLLFISFTVGSLWLFVYPTNAFLILALFLFIVAEKILLKDNNKEKFNTIFTKVVYFSAGIALSLGLWIIFSYAFGENPLDFFNRGQHFSDRVGMGIKQNVINLKKILKSNIFRFNPSILFIFMFFILNQIISFKRKIWSENNVVIFSFILAFIMQTIFINDFPERKLIIILPLILLAILSLAKDYIANHTENIPFRLSQTKRVLPIILAFLVFVYALLLNRSVSFNLMSILLSMGLISFFSYFYFKHRLDTRSLFIAFILLSGIEIVNTYHYSIRNYSTNYLNATQKLKQFNNANFIGGYSMGFRVNNDIQPYYNKYLHLGEFDKFRQKSDSLAKSNKVIDYSIGYAQDSLEYNKMGFESMEVLLRAEESVYTKDIIIYKEKAIE